MTSFTVIVPALNEEQNLRPTVEAVLREIGSRATFLEILVFDDASTDSTGKIADELARMDRRVLAFHNARSLNIGGIYKTGVTLARGDYVFLVPGDNETRVDEIARAFLFLQDTDVIVFHVTNPEVRSRGRRLISRAYVWVVNLLFGTTFLYTNGTNIFRTELIREIPIRTNGFSYQTEALVKAVRRGVDFVSIGVKLQTREAGESKAISWRNLRAVLKSLASLWWEINISERKRYRKRGRMLRLVS